MPALPRRVTGSSPALSQTLSVPRRRRHGLAIATAVITAAALGVVVSLLRTPSPDAEPAAPTAAPSVTERPTANSPTASGAAQSPANGAPSGAAQSPANAAAPSGTVPPVIVPPPPIAADAVIAPPPESSAPGAPSAHDGKPAPRPNTAGNRPAGRTNRVNKPDAERAGNAPAADGKSPATPGQPDCAWDRPHAYDASGNDPCAKRTAAPRQH
jgi:hypothetical protein